MGAGTSAQHAQLSLSDPKVCRSFLAGTCPHDLFTNTKQDLGPCPKVHSESLKQEYEGSAEKSKLGFEYDYMRDMQKYIDECNRRIDAAQRRLEKTPDEIRQTNDLVRAPSMPRPPLWMHCADIDCEIAQANLRLLAHHQFRPPRSLHPRRIRFGQPRRPRVLQDPYCKSRERRQGTGAQIAIGHLGPFGPPEAASLRRVWGVSKQIG